MSTSTLISSIWGVPAAPASRIDFGTGGTPQIDEIKVDFEISSKPNESLHSFSWDRLGGQIKEFPTGPGQEPTKPGLVTFWAPKRDHGQLLGPKI